MAGRAEIGRPAPTPPPGDAAARQNDLDHVDDRADHDGREKPQRVAAPFMDAISPPRLLIVWIWVLIIYAAPA